MSTKYEALDIDQAYFITTEWVLQSRIIHPRHRVSVCGNFIVHVK